MNKEFAMINPLELRLKNIVRVKGELAEVWTVFDKHINILSNEHPGCWDTIPIEKVEPEPLTQDWLKAMEFEVVRMRCVEKDGFRLYIWAKGTQFFFLSYEGATRTWVKTVHHLQNLFFAVKGTELIIKL